MREYFRQERLTFRYSPVFWLTRLLFVALVIAIPNTQLFFMLIASALSYGFRFETEEESLIPLTDDEIKRMRLTRCNMIWLRYLLVGLTGILLVYLFPEFIVVWGGMFERPWILGAFFVAQMAMVYEALLERAIDPHGKKGKHTPFRYVFCSLPTVICFIYAFNGVMVRRVPVFFKDGPEWIHAGILLAVAILFAVFCVRFCKEWKISDFKLSETKEKKVAKNN